MILRFVLALALLVPASASAERISYTHAAISVAATSTSALAAPASSNARRIVILQNDSDTVIYCNLAGGSAVVNQGVRINANGGTFLLDVVTPALAIACIHGGSGSKTLLVTHE